MDFDKRAFQFLTNTTLINAHAELAALLKEAFDAGRRSRILGVGFSDAIIDDPFEPKTVVPIMMKRPIK